MIRLTDLLKEVGEGITPYTFKQIKNTQLLVVYTFTTEDGDQYVVKFKSSYSQPNNYNLSFYPGTSASEKAEDDKIDDITNKGDLFKILSTVVSVVKNFISNNKNVSGISWIGVNSDKEGADKQRDLLYNAYLQKNINQFPNWKILPGTSSTKLKKITPNN
jgi:hypothetical protein